MSKYSPAGSRLFQAWKDPESGITSYVLRPVMAPRQKVFYFINDSFSADGRYLWCACRFPPSTSFYCGRIDLRDDSCMLCPETQFLDASPLVDEDGGIFWVSGNAVYRRGPEVNDKPVLVNEVPLSLIGNRNVKRISTHLTFRADKKALTFDMEAGARWYVGEIPLNGQAIQIWQEFDQCYNHTQFSPTDPNLQLICQDGWSDPATGSKGEYLRRMWLLKRGEKAEPIFQGHTTLHGHEWWAPDGKSIWYIHYGTGTCRVNISKGAEEVMVRHKPSHSYASRCGKYVVSDIFEHTSGLTYAMVYFYNLGTGKSVALFSESAQPEQRMEGIHFHPHPRFCCNDKYVVYSTVVKGTGTLAVTETRDLIYATL